MAAAPHDFLIERAFTVGEEDDLAHEAESRASSVDGELGRATHMLDHDVVAMSAGSHQVDHLLSR